MPTAMLTKGLEAPSDAAPTIPVKVAPEGIVTAIVAVTGVVDKVNDLIVPGAFAATLKNRRPKVVFQHKWDDQCGRTLHAEEWMPGDPRLPALTKDGQPWPAAAGALVAVMQYNLRSARAAEAFEMVRFYAESNEAEFSIGYQVPEGKARKRGAVRIILQVDLYEFSHVLFGAAPLSMALDVKDAGISTASGGMLTGPAFGADDDETPLVERPPLRAWDDTPTTGTTATKATDLVRGLVGGLEGKVSAGWAANEGNAENLRKWYVAGGDGAIGWGTPGDFDRCVAIAGQHMSEENAKGYCNLRHHDALGIYPATHAAETKTAPISSSPTSTAIEEKSMTYMTGSLEEAQSQLRDALEDLFTKDDPEDTHSWVCVRATFPTEVIVTVERGGSDEETSYLLDYSIDPDGTVTLGEPTEVELTMVASLPDGSTDDPEDVSGVLTDPDDPDDADPNDDGADDTSAEDDNAQAIAVAHAMAGQLMSTMMQAKSLARFGGVTSTGLRDAAAELLYELGGDPYQVKSDAPKKYGQDGEDTEMDTAGAAVATAQGDPEDDPADTPDPADGNPADMASAPADPSDSPADALAYDAQTQAAADAGTGGLSAPLDSMSAALAGADAPQAPASDLPDDTAPGTPPGTAPVMDPAEAGEDPAEEATETPAEEAAEPDTSNDAPVDPSTSPEQPAKPMAKKDDGTMDDGTPDDMAEKVCKACGNHMMQVKSMVTIDPDEHMRILTELGIE